MRISNIMKSICFYIALLISMSLFAESYYEYTRKKAEEGSAIDQALLGLMYADGEGVPENDQEAVKWYRKAADQGHDSAQYNLGVMYDLGEGVPENDQEAVKWYRKAADQGYGPAQSNLGAMYGKGKGVPEDYVKAYFWSNIAAVTDDVARKNRDILKDMMTPDQISEAQRLSTEYFEKNR